MEKNYNALYVSYWDGGTVIRTRCHFNPTTRIVTDVEMSEVDGLEVCEDEYIEYDGEEYRTFQHE